MVNPFTESSIEILKEAFPKVQESVIDDMLWTAKGNVQEAFEMLLSMTNGPVMYFLRKKKKSILSFDSLSFLYICLSL